MTKVRNPHVAQLTGHLLSSRERWKTEVKRLARSAMRSLAAVALLIQFFWILFHLAGLSIALLASLAVLHYVFGIQSIQLDPRNFS